MIRDHAIAAVSGLLLLLVCNGCASDRSAAANEVDAQQRIHGWLEALPMPPARPPDGAVRTKRDPLLDMLAGRWTATNLVDGRRITLDLTANWTQTDDPLHIELVSREIGAGGFRTFGAIGQIELNANGRDYFGDFSDHRGTAVKRWRGTGLGNDRASIAFQLFNGHRNPVRLTLTHNEFEDEWDLLLDDLRGGWTERLATLVFRRVPITGAEKSRP